MDAVRRRLDQIKDRLPNVDILDACAQCVLLCEQVVRAQNVREAILRHLAVRTCGLRVEWPLRSSAAIGRIACFHAVAKLLASLVNILALAVIQRDWLSGQPTRANPTSTEQSKMVHADTHKAIVSVQAHWAYTAIRRFIQVGGGCCPISIIHQESAAFVRLRFKFAAQFAQGGAVVPA